MIGVVITKKHQPAENKDEDAILAKPQTHVTGGNIFIDLLLRSDLEQKNGWLCNNCGMNQRRGRRRFAKLFDLYTYFIAAHLLKLAMKMSSSIRLTLRQLLNHQKPSWNSQKQPR